MRKFFCTAALVCVSLTPATTAQDRPFAQQPLPVSDPFRISVGSLFSAGGAGAPGRPRLMPESVTSDFQEALDLIDRNYGGSAAVDKSELTSFGIASMLRSLDPHSTYYTPDEFRELLGEHASEYSGTGTSMAGFERNGAVETYFLSAAKDSPAARAGIRFGDRLISVDGQAAANREPSFARQKLRGEKGTAVSVVVERADTLQLETLTIRRDRIREPAVPEPFVFDGVGYIDLTSGFSNLTCQEFEKALEKLKARGARSLVIDLRGNGGGILDQAIRVAEKLLPAGSIIASQRGRYAGDEKTWRSRADRHDTRPVVLLVDEQTASASEVLAGALQDNDRALIVGTKTFGKGLVQSVLNLPQGAGMTLTAARYFTPSGRSIQREYGETGLYDYYHQRGAAGIDKPLYASKTITNRVVFGGDGISPDEYAIDRAFTPARIRLLDPIFHFVRDRLRSDSGLQKNSGDLPAGLRKSTDFPTIDTANPADSFAHYLEDKPEWDAARPYLVSERDFVEAMLKYYFALATAGPEDARRIAVESDPQFRQAIKALPRAAQLAAAAEKTRRSPFRKQKSSLSRILSEQR